MLRAVEAVEVFQQLAREEADAVETGILKYSVWKFLTMFDIKVCTDCYLYQGDEYELEDPHDLQLIFQDGYFIDPFTYAPMIHPNDRCKIERVRDYNEESKLMKRVRAI